LYITKYDVDQCSSFTVSCRPNGDKTKWISFHSWIPQDYLWDRENCYAISDSKIYKMNDKKSFLNFLGQQFPFVVDAVVNTGGQDFRYETTSLNTLAIESGKKDLDITFNHIGIFNDTQSTGTRPVEVFSDNNGKTNSIIDRTKFNPSILKAIRTGKRFKISNAKDLVNNDCEEAQILQKACECDPIGNLNEEIISCNNLKESDFKNRTFRDDYLQYRLIFDQNTTTKLYLKSISTEIDGDGNEQMVNK
jgi:hypothetical protein